MYCTRNCFQCGMCCRETTNKLLPQDFFTFSAYTDICYWHLPQSALHFDNFTNLELILLFISPIIIYYLSLPCILTILLFKIFLVLHFRKCHLRSDPIKRKHLPAASSPIIPFYKWVFEFKSSHAYDSCRYEELHIVA